MISKIVLRRLADVFHAAAAAQTERHEIGAYATLVELARALDQPDAAKLLEQTLIEERDALKHVSELLPRLARQAAEPQILVTQCYEVAGPARRPSTTPKNAWRTVAWTNARAEISRGTPGSPRAGW